MFGNPGTTEQGLLDAVSDFPSLEYVLTLQETVAVAIADGYARATKRPTLVQLHSGVGLGNAIGMLYQARRGHSPLVAFTGDSGVRYDAMDAQMAARLVDMAEPVTKWATRVTDPSSLLRVMRRATKIASTPPMAPRARGPAHGRPRRGQRRGGGADVLAVHARRSRARRGRAGGHPPDPSRAAHDHRR